MRLFIAIWPLCSPAAMLSIVIPTLNAAAGLAATLECLAVGSGELGDIEIVIADGGSTDTTADLAMKADAGFISAEKGRGNQLAAGASAAQGDWLLFIHADTILQAGWEDVVAQFIAEHSVTKQHMKAAVFNFELDDSSVKARVLEAIVAFRTTWLALPYGDQGLLISRHHYNQVGGFRPIPIMEDVDIVRRIGRRDLTVLDCSAVTSARRYRNEGYLRRMSRNIVCLSMWFLGVAPEKIAKAYS